MRYRKEIDGLRAVAVLPVILFHAGIGGFDGGYVGVDVFFVISGYLITLIILEERERDSFSLIRFYERRIRRILPALFLVMAICIPLAWYSMPPHQMKDFSQSLVAATVFASNVFFYLETDYFNPFAETSPLLHTWSLAIEEQFYLVFPLFVITVWRFGRKPLFWAIALISITSLALSEWAWRYDRVANFYLTPSRMWELMMGALCAIYLKEKPQSGNDLLSIAGLLLILLAVILFDSHTPFPSLYTLVPAVGTAFIILYANQETYAGRFLSFPLIVGIGLVSYSAYLWHQPLLAFSRVLTFNNPTVWTTALCFVLIAVMSVLSWRFVERPFRRGMLNRPQLFSFFLLAAIAFVSFGYIGHTSIGFQQYKLSNIPEPMRRYVVDREFVMSKRNAVWPGIMDLAARPFDKSAKKKNLLILGDSVGADLYVVMTIHQNLFTSIEARMSTLDDGCFSQYLHSVESQLQPENKCRSEIERLVAGGLTNEADVIVLAAAWQSTVSEDVAMLAYYFIRNGKEVIVLGSANFNEMTSISMVVAEKGLLPENAKSYFFRNLRTDWRRNSMKVKSQVEAINGVVFRDKAEIFCDLRNEECTLYDAKGHPLIYDTEHLTREGVDFFAGRLVELGWF